MRGDLADRLWANVNKDGPISEHRPELGPCWLWLKYKNPNGYGEIMATIKGKRRAWLCHRISFEILVGPIPRGKELDHLCRTPACLNPAHLEAVTHTENILRGNSPYAQKARQTHCSRGHEFTPDNTMRNSVSGTRFCRLCNLMWNRAESRRERERLRLQR